MLSRSTLRAWSTISRQSVISKRSFHSSLRTAVSFLTYRQSNANYRVLNILNKTQIRQIWFAQPLYADIIEVEGPAFAESISEGDIRWIKQIGDYVNEDELVAEIETDKTAVEVPAPHSGVIVELLVEDGGKVTAKQKLYKLDREGAPGEKKDTPTVPAAKSVEEASSTVSEKPAAATPVKPATPMEDVHREEVKIPPESERIQKKPIAGEIPVSIPPIPKVPAAPISSKDTSKIPITPLKTPIQAGAREETRVKINRMRLRIAQRLKDAQNTYAMLTTFNEVDMSNVIEMRSRYQKAFTAQHGIKLGLMSPFVKAAAYALQENPTVNAVIDEGEIIYRHYVDMSIAVATPKGLVVPVLKNVDTMDYATIEKELFNLGAKARDGKLAIEDMEGGTFTISNGGVFGSMFGTPIINPPQSAILGMHAIFDRPVAINGKVEIRPIMTVALTYDHRLIDGREAVTFLKKIKSSVEDPRTILMNI